MVVAQIDAQPTKVVAQVVYLAEQSPCDLVAQIWASPAVLVKKAAFQHGHLPDQDGSLG
jgi:hypothetical protein